MRYLVVFICFFFIGYGCNPVKRVLKSTEKTQQVVDAWLQRTPIGTDTAYKYLPGDTVTQILIGYDTAYIKGDTVHKVDTIKIKERAIKLLTVRDTLVKTITDNRLVTGCQTALNNALLAKKDSDALAVKWKWKFWGLLAIIVIAGLVYLLIRSKVL